MRRQVVVTGLGAVTAFGEGAPVFWEALLGGRSAIAEVWLFDAARYVARRAAQVTASGDPLATDREAADASSAAGGAALRGRLGFDTALRAAREAVAAARLDPSGERVGVVTGTTLGGNLAWSGFLETGNGSLVDGSTLNALTSRLALALGARGPASTVSVACASGTAAVGLAAEWIQEGWVDAVVAGGYDALSEFVFSGFDSLRALSASAARPFDGRRDGLTLGEGAGFLVLEERARAERRGAEPLAVLTGYASSSDAHHMTRPPANGEGLARAGEAVLSRARIRPEDVGFVSAHGTATVFNDRMEAAALRSMLGPRVSEVPVNSIKGAIGHTLGAAGALEAVMCVRVLQTSLVPPTAGCEEPEPLGLSIVRERPRDFAAGSRAVLSTSAAFGGTNAVLALERP